MEKSKAVRTGRIAYFALSATSTIAFISSFFVNNPSYLPTVIILYVAGSVLMLIWSMFIPEFRSRLKGALWFALAAMILLLSLTAYFYFNLVASKK